MAFEAAKEILQKAESPTERSAAVEAAMAQGMPLSSIEAYLDWLEATDGSDEFPGEQASSQSHGDRPRQPK